VDTESQRTTKRKNGKPTIDSVEGGMIAALKGAAGGGEMK